MEDFDDIIGYVGIYKINRNGDVLCCRKNKLLKFHYDKDGYKIVSLNQKPTKIHRLLAIQYIPNNDETKTEIDHIDRNRTNNSLENLRWTNREEQCRNRSRNGCISVYSGFRKNGEPYTNYRGSYTIPDKNGKMIVVRKSSCIDKQIVEDWLEEIKAKYP